MTKVTNGLTVTVALLVALIAAGSFTLSYNALRATGQAGGIPPALTWLWPLLIDLPLCVFTLAMLSAQLTRQSIKLWAALVIGYSLATIGFNLSHAQPTPLGWTVAVVAPVGLLLTTEALRHLSRGIIERSHAILSLAELTGQVDTRQAHLDRLNGQVEQTTAKLAAVKAELKACNFQQNARSVTELNAARAAKIEARRDRVLEMLQSEMSHDAIAAELGFSVRTIRNDIKQLNGKVLATG